MRPAPLILIPPRDRADPPYLEVRRWRRLALVSLAANAAFLLALLVLANR